MRRMRLAIAIQILAGVLAADARGQSLVIRGGTLIDGTGKPPFENTQILIRDGVIADMSPGGPLANVEAIDARGKFIVPGLIDSHIHYRDWETELLLAYGVTSVNDLGNPYYWQAALDRGFNSGRMRGPRFFFGGEILLPSDEAARSQPTVVRRGLDVIHKPDEAPAIVSRLKDAGATSIKLNEQFKGDVFSAIARAGDRAGLKVISHSLNIVDSLRRKVQQFLAQFVRAGGKIYAGTDTSAATTPGLSLHHELQLLVDAGLTPMQALMAATSWGAEVMGQDRRLGTIEKGKRADLVLLDADPLQDIRSTKKIFKVIKDGRVVDTAYHADYAIAIKRPGPESKHLYNPIPVLQDVVPPVAVEGTSTTLRLVGRGFTRSSVVRFDGRVVDTRWVSATELTATLTAQQTARVGTFLLTVDTPKPGGGLSHPVEFMIVFKQER